MIQFRDPFSGMWRPNRCLGICLVAIGVLACAVEPTRADLNVNAFQGGANVPPAIQTIDEGDIMLPFSATLTQTDGNEGEEHEHSVATSDFVFEHVNSFTFFTGFDLLVSRNVGAYSLNYGSFRFSPDGDTSFEYDLLASFEDLEGDDYSAEYTLKLLDVTDNSLLINFTDDPEAGFDDEDIPGLEVLLATHVYELSYSYNAYRLPGADPSFAGQGGGSFTIDLLGTDGVQILTIPAPGAVILAATGLALVGMRRRRST